MLLSDTPIVRATSPTAGAVPHTFGPGAAPQNTTLDEERREILESVLGALAGHPPDPDEMAACGNLLKHLSQTALGPGCHSA